MAPTNPAALRETADTEIYALQWSQEREQLRSQFEAQELAEKAAYETSKKAVEDAIKKERQSFASCLSQEDVQQAVDRVIELNNHLKELELDFQTRKAEREKMHEKKLRKHLESFSSLFPASLGLRSPEKSPAPAISAHASPDRSPAASGHVRVNGNHAAASWHHPLNGQQGAEPKVVTAFTSPQPSAQPLRQTASPKPGSFTPAKAPLAPKPEPSAATGTSRPAPAYRRDLPGISVFPTTNKRKADSGHEKPQEQNKRARVETKAADAAEASGAGALLSPRRRTPQNSLPGTRTISFHEVFQDGNAEYKHIIVEFPPASAKWYVLRCDEHMVHFGRNPLLGAAKHLHSAQHGHLPKVHATAVELLGHLVFDCTARLAAQNNSVTTKAFDRGYEPFNVNRLSKSERLSQGLPVNTPPTGGQNQSASRRGDKSPAFDAVRDSPEARQHRPFVGVTDPTPGELYVGYWSHTRTQYVVMVLPWGDLSICGKKGTLAKTGLLNTTPRCYLVDRLTQEIRGWAKGYEDHGPLVTKREFPVMYFDDGHSVSWLKARYIAPFRIDEANRLNLPHFEDARNYYARVKGFTDYAAMRESREAQVAGVDGAGPAVATTPIVIQEKEREREVTVHAEGGGGRSPVLPSALPAPSNAPSGPDSRNTQTTLADAPQPGVGASAPGDQTPDATMEVSGQDGNAVDEQMPDVSAAAGGNDSPQQDEQPEREYLSHGPGETTGVETGVGAHDQRAAMASKPVEATNSSQNNSSIGPLGAAVDRVGLADFIGSANDPPLVPSRSPTMEDKHVEPPAGDLRASAGPSQSGDTVGDSTPATSKVQEVRQIAAQVLNYRSPEREPPTTVDGRRSVSLAQDRTSRETSVSESAQTSRPVQPGPVSGPQMNAASRGTINRVGPLPAMRSFSFSGDAESRNRSPASLHNILQHEPQEPPRHFAYATPAAEPPAVAKPNGSHLATKPPGDAQPPQPSQVPRQPMQIITNHAQGASRASPGSVPPAVSPKHAANPAVSERSTSSTPGPASNPPSRGPTPTAFMRGDDSLNRWRAVRTESISSAASQTQQPQHSPMASPSLDGGPQFGSTLNSSIEVKSDPTGNPGEKDEYYDLLAYFDTKGQTFMRQRPGPCLRLTVDNLARVAETAPSEAVEVVINPRHWSQMMADTVDRGGRTIVRLGGAVGLRAELTFDETINSGRRQNGTVQARRFCRWMRSVNPAIDYRNNKSAQADIA